MSGLLALTCSGYLWVETVFSHFIDLFNILYKILTIYFSGEVGALREQFGRLEAAKGPATTENIGGNVHGCVAIVIS